MFRFALVGWCLLAVMASSVNAAVLYDFENPPYSLGNLNGQNGWFGGGIRANVVPQFGQQSLELQNDFTVHSLAGSGFGNVTSLSYLTAVTPNAYAEVILTDSNNDSYAHVGFQDSATNDGYYIESDTSLLFTSSPVASNTIYSVNVTLDFNAQQYRAVFTDFVANTLVYDSGFVDLRRSTTAALAKAGQIELYAGAGADSGYFDNISITSVPEPTTAFLAICGVLGFSVSRRRKLNTW